MWSILYESYFPNVAIRLMQRQVYEKSLRSSMFVPALCRVNRRVPVPRAVRRPFQPLGNDQSAAEDLFSRSLIGADLSSSDTVALRPTPPGPAQTEQTFSGSASAGGHWVPARSPPRPPPPRPGVQT